MSEQPGIPNDLSELENLVRAAQLIALQDSVIRATAAMHGKWYRAWQEEGIPEERAAEFIVAMITAGLGQP